ncbi:unnamed protein product [Rotaria socialis]|uniref:Uncharacterized protein n=1 Tax=Rotaria socialis TaxID=392032 RepID=A0A817TQK7_9BILA|nr:unnamed protein product [Rotaria socialis]CAF3323974.1 unnamed protein product [Rotaria socialis]CAF3372227.1 unnamed protein product [Rotaria socialis]CAF3556692.1 unnamed protein product [Rotaria socialis]CAF3625667.1 unnamed protein product [Rotaria socialis]
MGNSKSTRKFLELKHLEEITGINRQEFSKIHEEMKRKNGDEDVVLIDRSDCRHFINRVGVGAYNQKQVDSAFEIFLRDGKMTSEQLFSCVVMLSETMDGVARLTYVVDTHNPKGANETIITRKYGQRILKYVAEFYDIKKAAEPAQVWTQICGENDPTQVTRDEFIKYISTTAPYKDFLI